MTDTKVKAKSRTPCETCGDPATQWDYDQLMAFCDRHVQQGDFTVPIEESCYLGTPERRTP